MIIFKKERSFKPKPLVPKTAFKPVAKGGGRYAKGGKLKTKNK
jgi:hypothetical protein